MPLIVGSQKFIFPRRTFFLVFGAWVSGAWGGPPHHPSPQLRGSNALVEGRSLAWPIPQVSNYTMGILAMEKTLVGVIQVDPHKLLEEGIRKALVNRISGILHEALFFPKKDKLTFQQRCGAWAGGIGERCRALATSGDRPVGSSALPAPHPHF